MTEQIILASGSPFRKKLLHNAGISFEVVPADIDERAVEGRLPAAGLLRKMLQPFWPKRRQ